MEVRIFENTDQSIKKTFYIRYMPIIPTQTREKNDFILTFFFDL